MRFTRLLRGTFQHFSKHGDLLAAAISYYAVLSIAPLVVIALSMAGILYEEEHAKAELLRSLEQVTGAEIVESISSMLDLATRGSSLLATAFATLMLIWAASRLFAQIQEALNLIWGVRVRGGSARFLRQLLIKRVLSIGMVLISGGMLLATLLVQTALDALDHRLGSLGELQPLVMAMQQGAVALGLLTLLIAAMYRVLPDVSIQWRDVWVGAAITSLLVLVGTWLLSLYLGRIAPTWLQGAIGALSVFMIWTYYLALVFLVGAAFTRSWAEQNGRAAQLQAHTEARPPLG